MAARHFNAMFFLTPEANRTAEHAERRQMQQQNAAANWAKRAWLVGLIGGNIAGLLYVIGDESNAGRIHLPTPSWLPGAGGTTPLVIVAALLGQFLLPLFLSGTTQRCTFWWGLIPIILYNGWALADTYVSPHSASLDTFRLVLLARIPIVLLLTSGPVSLVRYLSGRGRQKQEAMRQAAQSQAVTPQEGSWPPPPARPQ